MDTEVAQVLKAEEVAKRLRVDVYRIYALVRERKLKSFRIGRSIRFRVKDIEAFEDGGGCPPKPRKKTKRTNRRTRK